MRKRRKEQGSTRLRKNDLLKSITTIFTENPQKTYNYKQISNLLEIESGKDLCTLVTCTPYGINTHRLLVRGHRIETAAEAHTVRVSADAVQIGDVRAEHPGKVVLETPLGGTRLMDMLEGEQLPRIC